MDDAVPDYCRRCGRSALDAVMIQANIRRSLGVEWVCLRCAFALDGGQE